MLIQCTKKLLDQLGIKPDLEAVEKPLFSWHANLLIVNRRKTVALVNDQNRYTIVLYGLKAKDFRNLDKLIMQAIQETFLEEGMKEEVIETFMSQSKWVKYTRTKDRASVARMNKSCELVSWFDDLIIEDSISQGSLSRKINRSLMGHGSNHYIMPNEELYKDLEVFAGRPIIGCRAVELKVTLRLEKQVVWRKLVLPLNMYFEEFHKVLQAAFGWRNYHCHEFFIYSDKILRMELSMNHPAYTREGLKPIINLVSDEESFAYPNGIEMRDERAIRLSEYIPGCKRLKYNYDFGDNWQHDIEVEKVIEDYKKNYPICLDGQGNTPPEDVGGAGMYEEFLEIIADKNDPEHEQTVLWAKGQGYGKFDIDKVNRELKITVPGT